MRLESPIDPYIVFRRHKKVTRFGRVMRCLLGDIVSSRMVRVFPVTCKSLSENWIQRLLDTPVVYLAFASPVDGATASRDSYGGLICQPLRYNFTTDTKRSTGSSTSGIGRRVSGCAMKLSGCASAHLDQNGCKLLCALCDPLQHRSRLQDKRWQHHSTQVGTWP